MPSNSKAATAKAIAKERKHPRKARVNKYPQPSKSKETSNV